jgi:hypothetical protein
MRVKELNDELMRTYHSRDFKNDLLDDAQTRLQHAQDELMPPRATSTTSRLSCMGGTSNSRRVRLRPQSYRMLSSTCMS